MKCQDRNKLAAIIYELIGILIFSSNQTETRIGYWVGVFANGFWYLNKLKCVIHEWLWITERQSKYFVLQVDFFVYKWLIFRFRLITFFFTWFYTCSKLNCTFLGVSDFWKAAVILRRFTLYPFVLASHFLSLCDSQCSVKLLFCLKGGIVSFYREKSCTCCTVFCLPVRLWSYAEALSTV